MGACVIPKVYISMLWPLSWDDDNCLSMFLRWMTYNQVLSVVMRRLQLSEHVSYLRDILSCSDCCFRRRWQLSEHVSYLRDISPCRVRSHLTMTTKGACRIHACYITMLWPFSCDDDNCRSMFHSLGISYHALTVVMRRWQLLERVSYLKGYNTMLRLLSC